MTTNTRPSAADIAEYKRLLSIMVTLDYRGDEYKRVRAMIREIDDQWKQMARRPTPEGFEPVWEYDSDGVPTQRDDVIEITLNDTRFEFDVRASLPVLPLRHTGQLWHSGWDIPTRYAIDAKGICYMDNGHGHALCRVPQTSLEAECENEVDIAQIREVLWKKPKLPAWMRTALDSGWTPPSTFNASDYE